MRDLALRPLHFLLAWFATLCSRRLMQENEYLKTENRLLRQQLGTRRPRFSDADRRELASKALALGRKALAGLVTIVTPDTLLRWHRRLIAAKWTQSGRRPGRPRKPRDIRAQVVRFARENALWGYTRLLGAIQNLGLPISRTTIRSILKENGIRPAPERETSWRQFLKSHAAAMVAMDFFTTEVWTSCGLRTIYTLFAIDHHTRAVEILGSTANPCGQFMAQVARNLTGVLQGWWREKTLLLAEGQIDGRKAREHRRRRRAGAASPAPTHEHFRLEGRIDESLDAIGQVELECAPLDLAVRPGFGVLVGRRNLGFVHDLLDASQLAGQVLHGGVPLPN